MKTNELTHLEIMNQMTIEDNKGISLTTSLTNAVHVDGGTIISFGVERNIGEDAYKQKTTGLPGKYILCAFAIDREQLELTRKKMNHEKSENSPKAMAERFEQLPCVKISKLYWLMCQYENNELKEMLCEMDQLEFNQCFPGVLSNPYTSRIQHDEDEIINTLSDCGFTGLFAQVEYPEMSDFQFRESEEDALLNDTNYRSCTICSNVVRYGYVYAETKEDLLKKIESQSVEMTKYWIAEFKKANNK